MALIDPIILVDSATGSDSAASGAGPATALTGSAGVSDGAGLVTLDGSPNLSGVSATGTDAIYFADATAGNKNFAKITAVDNGAKTVTVTPALAAGTKAWAIGGKRASIGSATSKKLFDNNSTAGDAQPGWIVELQSGHVEPAISATFSFRRAGDTTNGPIILRGKAGAATRPKVVFSNNGTMFSIPNGMCRIENLEITNTSGTKGSTTAILVGAINHVTVKNIKIADATDNVNKGIDVTGAGTIVRDCEVARCLAAGVTIGNVSTVSVLSCYIHDNTSHGIDFSGGSQPVGIWIEGNIIARNGGDGIRCSYSGTANKPSVFVANVIDANTSDGIEWTATALTDCAYTSTLVDDNQFTNNGNRAINFSAGGAITNIGIQADCFQMRNNNHYNNTNGLSNLTLTFDENTTNQDPGYTNAAGGDFSEGTNPRAKGYPIGGTLAIGTGSSTYNYIDIGMQRVHSSGRGRPPIVTFGIGVEGVHVH